MSWWAWVLIGLVVLLALIVIGFILTVRAVGETLAEGLNDYFNHML